ncbi:MAG: S41 family peptidase, partial [Planctomycetota bacterium]
AKQFQPKWQPPGDEFSEWHYLVLSQRNNQKHRYHYSKPVVVLTNAKCFSATDIFVAGMKELSNVTLMGTSTGGGSARTTGVRISRGIDLRIGSMISYQTDGTLFDGNGVSPDIYVEPEPGYFVGQSDSLMNAAMEHIQSQRQGGK